MLNKNPQTKIECSWSVWREEEEIVDLIGDNLFEEGGIVLLREQVKDTLEFVTKLAKIISNKHKCELITVHHTRNFVCEEYGISLNDESLTLKDCFTVKMSDKTRQSFSEGSMLFEFCKAKEEDGVKVFIVHEDYLFNEKHLSEFCKENKILLIISYGVSKDLSIMYACEKIDTSEHDYDKFMLVSGGICVEAKLKQRQEENKTQLIQLWKNALKENG